MNQIFTIAKIAGESGREILKRFQEWHENMQFDDGNIIKIDDANMIRPRYWPSHCCQQMNSFYEELCQNSFLPPVLFFCRYVDTWSAGWGQLMTASEKARNGFIEVASDRIELACYWLPDNNVLSTEIDGLLKEDWTPEEFPWFLTVLGEAVRSWELVINESAIVLVREVVGGIVSDREVEASVKTVAPWIDRKKSG